MIGSLTNLTVNSRCLKESAAEAAVVEVEVEAEEGAVEAEVAAVVAEVAAVEAVVVAVGEEEAAVATAEVAVDMEAMAEVAMVAMAGVEAAAGKLPGKRPVFYFN
jgi:hypothetical protein